MSTNVLIVVSTRQRLAFPSLSTAPATAHIAVCSQSFESVPCRSVKVPPSNSLKDPSLHSYYSCNPCRRPPIRRNRMKSNEMWTTKSVRPIIILLILFPTVPSRYLVANDVSIAAIRTGRLFALQCFPTGSAFVDDFLFPGEDVLKYPHRRLPVLTSNLLQLSKDSIIADLD